MSGIYSGSVLVFHAFLLQEGRNACFWLGKQTGMERDSLIFLRSYLKIFPDLY